MLSRQVKALLDVQWRPIVQPRGKKIDSCEYQLAGEAHTVGIFLHDFFGEGGELFNRVRAECDAIFGRQTVPVAM